MFTYDILVDQTGLTVLYAREQTSQKQVITIIDNSGDCVRAPVLAVPFAQVRRWRYIGAMAVDGVVAPKATVDSSDRAVDAKRSICQC